MFTAGFKVAIDLVAAARSHVANVARAGLVSYVVAGDSPANPSI